MTYSISSLLTAWHAGDPDANAPSRAELAGLDRDLRAQLEGAVVAEAQRRGLPVTPHVTEVLVVMAAASNGASAGAKAASACSVLGPYVADVTAEEAGTTQPIAPSDLAAAGPPRRLASRATAARKRRATRAARPRAGKRAAKKPARGK